MTLRSLQSREVYAEADDAYESNRWMELEGTSRGVFYPDPAPAAEAMI